MRFRHPLGVEESLKSRCSTLSSRALLLLQEREPAESSSRPKQVSRSERRGDELDAVLPLLSLMTLRDLLARRCARSGARGGSSLPT